jgi:hypothetical protein
LLYEGDGLSAPQIAALEALGHNLMAGRFNIAVAASLRRTASGWTGAFDPRALGSAGGH